MAHPNEELTRRGSMPSPRATSTPSESCSIKTLSGMCRAAAQLSGDHRGLDAILGNFAKTAELTGGTFRIDLHDVVANDEHAVSIYVARGEREGRPGGQAGAREPYPQRQAHRSVADVRGPVRGR